MTRTSGVPWDSEQKSRSGLDNKARCGDCDKQSDVKSRVMCALCSSSVEQDEEDPFAGVESGSLKTQRAPKRTKSMALRTKKS